MAKMLELKIDTVHIRRLEQILGVPGMLEWHKPDMIESFIDETYARMFPSQQDQEVEQEYREHEESRRI